MEITQSHIEVLTEIQEDENGRFKNAVEFVNEKEMIIYFMNREGDIREINIDIADLPRIVERYSSIHVNGEGYPQGVIRGTKKNELLHRFVIGYTAEGFVCHHKNAIKTDNRKSNLEEITFADNCRAARKVASKSGFRNVDKTPNGKYRVRITKDGVEQNCGTYPTAEAANEIAIEKRREIFGNLE